MSQVTLKREDTVVRPVLYMAMELSNQRWKLAFSHRAKRRHVTVVAGRIVELREAIEQARQRFGLDAEVRLVSGYAAGRDGFWRDRYLRISGIENGVVDAASREVSRRQRRVKTDRVEVDSILTKLIRYHGGEQDSWSGVRVPSVEEADARRLPRELERLKRERGAHRCRMQSLLVAQGIRCEVKGDFLACLKKWTLWDGRALLAELQGELEREYARYALLQRQIQELEATRHERLRAPRTAAERQVVQ